MAKKNSFSNFNLLSLEKKVTIKTLMMINMKMNALTLKTMRCPAAINFSSLTLSTNLEITKILNSAKLFILSAKKHNIESYQIFVHS